MENKLQKTQDNNIVKLTDKELQIASEIYEVNLLAPYPLTSIQIEDWSRSLNKLLPNLEISVLEKLIDDFKTDAIEWNYKKGIQNIFIGLRSYERRMVY